MKIDGTTWKQATKKHRERYHESHDSYIRLCDIYDSVKGFEAIATHRKVLLRRANMALLCYTQSHGTPPHTQLLIDLAEELGLDADGNTLEKELGDAK